MKRFRIFTILLIILLLSGIVYSESSQDVYIIPIKGEINNTLYNFLAEEINKANLENPAAIIFEIDTYGGYIDHAEKIKNLIVNIEVPTISYINNKAQSAGVLVSLASENVVMASSSSIGSAETNPNTDKVMSMWKGLLRDIAQLRNRDGEIIQAMADKSIKGELINLTGNEALQYGIADLISDDYNDILANFNIQYGEALVVEEGIGMRFSRILSNPIVNTLLLTIGFVGLVVELFTPGFGVGGTISIIGFGLFFGGHLAAGNTHWTSLVLFVLGLGLLIIEAIVPGFGLPGISGILFILIGIVLAMGSTTAAITSLSIAIIIAAIVTIIMIKYGFKSTLFTRIVLSSKLGDEEGYKSSSSKTEYLDKEGIALSGLRPSGVIEIDGIKLDALTEGDFVTKGSPIKVIRVEGSKIFVRRI